MLRITEKKEGDKTRVLHLEGKLCQDYVRELQVEIAKGVDTGEKIVLDLAKVVFLDDEAARMINTFKDSRLSLRNCSLFIRTALNIKENKKGGKI
jgi:anti-anti-sigma regulatory factor